MSPQAPHPRRRRRILLGVGVVALLVVAGAVFAATRRRGDISHPDVEFRSEPTPTTPAPPPPAKAKADPYASFVWPMYGYTADRRRFLPAPASLRPPFRRRWTVNARKLLEFPPVLGGKALYVLNDGAVMVAVAKNHGRVLWRRRFGSLAAASPAYGGGVLYAVILERAPGQAGRVVAIRAKDGRTIWSHALPSRAESSPLLVGGRLYFGTESGTVYALRASNGSTVWRAKASGAVKGGLALSGGKLFFGDYGGRVYALRRTDGRQLWSVGTSGTRFGLGSGRFYATASVAFGRVYLGNTDGNVYSFAQDSGKLAWRTRTGGYVYSSAAVAQVPRLGPSVFVGSYDGTFYALDARSGKVRWSKHEGGAISGGSTLVGDIVYSANIRTKRTTGYSARTGRVVFTFPDGSYNPVVSDGRTIFLDGYKRIYALRPRAAGKAAR
jgi:outer membrane protein assembly factor BamB